MHARALLPLYLFVTHQVFGGGDSFEEAQLLNLVVILPLGLDQGNLRGLVAIISLFWGDECLRHYKLHVLFPYAVLHTLCLVAERPVAELSLVKTLLGPR